MPQTPAGIIKYRQTMIRKYGSEKAWREFMQNIGARGGANGNTGGFATNKEFAAIAGSKGGTISKRGYTHVGNGEYVKNK